MADRKLIEKIDAVMDVALVILGFSQFRRRGAQQAVGVAPVPTSRRPPSPPKIPEILANMEDGQREEASGWLARYAPEAMDKLELLKIETLQKIFDAPVEKREQMVKSLRLPFAGPQTIPQKARFAWVEMEKKLKQMEEKLPKTAAAIHESAEKRRHKEEERKVARQNPKSGVQMFQEWRAARRNKKKGGN